MKLDLRLYVGSRDVKRHTVVLEHISSMYTKVTTFFGKFTVQEKCNSKTNSSNEDIDSENPCLELSQNFYAMKLLTGLVAV